MFLVELREEGAPEVEPDVLALPLVETAPARRGARILLRQIFPAGAGAKDPEDPLEALAIIGRGPTATLARLPLRQMRLDLGPLLVGETLHTDDRSRRASACKKSQRAIGNRSI